MDGCAAVSEMPTSSGATFMLTAPGVKTRVRRMFAAEGTPSSLTLIPPDTRAAFRRKTALDEKQLGVT
jgi:hypothetical protein